MCGSAAWRIPYVTPYGVWVREILRGGLKGLGLAALSRASFEEPPLVGSSRGPALTPPPYANKKRKQGKGERNTKKNRGGKPGVQLIPEFTREIGSTRYGCGVNHCAGP